jgi:hypothetical protein
VELDIKSGQILNPALGGDLGFTCGFGIGFRLDGPVDLKPLLREILLRSMSPKKRKCTNPTTATQASTATDEGLADAISILELEVLVVIAQAKGEECPNK